MPRIGASSRMASKSLVSKNSSRKSTPATSSRPICVRPTETLISKASTPVCPRGVSSSPISVLYDFTSFFLIRSGIAIYPGKVTDAECFRIGNIGQLFPEDLHNLVKNVEKVLNLMSVPIPVTYN